MKQIIIIIVIGLVLLQFLKKPETPYNPNGKINMSQVFKSDHNDAKRAAAYFYALADTIEWDGKNEKPKYLTDLALEQYRVDSLVFATKGWGFEKRFPGFGSQVGGYLDTQIGTEPQAKLDDARRAKWVKTWREIADACVEAGKN
jgi:hypothetical protein